MIHHSPPTLVIDVAALAAMIGAVAGQLPTIMGLLAAIYYLFAIIDLVKRWRR